MMETGSETTLVRLKPEIDPEVVAFYKQALSLRDYAEKRVIVAAGDLKVATEDLALISRLKKALEEKRKEYLKPLQDHVRSINVSFQLLTEPVEAADLITRKKILAYQAEQERIRQEQERINTERIKLAEAEMKLKGELSEPVNLVAVIPEVARKIDTEVGSAGQRVIRKYRVVNFALLPDEYKMENSALLNKVVKAGCPSIPGVEIYTETILAVNTR